MDDPALDVARVPPQLVLASATAMWSLYYGLVTVRSLLFDDGGDIPEMLWRRAVVTLVGIVVTMLAWPLIARFDSQRLPLRAVAALVVMLPASLLLALVNQKVFEPVEMRQAAREAATQAQPGRGVQIVIPANDEGTMLIDGGAQRADVLRRAAEARRDALEAAREAAQEARDAARDAAQQARENARDAAQDARDALREAGIAPRRIPAPPAPPATPTAPAAQVAPARPAKPRIVITTPGPPNTAQHAQAMHDSKDMSFQLLTDIVLSRYFLLVAWAALYLALGNAQAARAAERREGEYRRAAKAAELRSLRYQVNPHFLFNTLNSLSALVMVGRVDEAERMIQSIARFYRHSLAADPTADLPLADEIALQRHYLAIEAVRFPERLVAEFDIPQGLESACVPGMILQPLVENSIKYAVSPSRGPVTIRISAREAGSLLVLTVADDGPGAAQPVTSGTGIGLANVRLRLEARFGRGAHLESAPLPAGGYASILTLPLVRDAC